METMTAQPATATVETGVIEKLVSITLKEEDYQGILDTNNEFGAIAQYLVEQFAGGGIMIPVGEVGYLTDITRVPIYSSTDIVKMVESTVKRHSPDGMLRVTTDIDPAFAPGLEELAYAQGRTVDEIVQESLNIVLTNSWIYSLAVDGGTIPLLASQRMALERIIGKSPLTSDILVTWVESMAAQASGSRRAEPETQEMVQVKPYRPEDATPKPEEIGVPEGRMSKAKRLVMERMGAM